MKAVVKTGRGVGQVQLLDRSKPEVTSEDVLIQVKSAGICGTDVHIYRDLAFYVPPVILGHEYSGVVVEVGSNVKNIHVGDRVTSPATIPCGECYLCRIGSQNRCIGEKRRVLGALGGDGAFAEYMKVPARVVHKIPDNVSFEEAAVAEPAACAVHAITERTQVDVGDTVVILGPGPMGLLSLQVAKAEGAGQVMVTGTGADEKRLEIAKHLGAGTTVNVEEENLVEMVKDLTDGLGADVVVEASGSSAARKQALDLVRRRGRVTLVGLTGEPTGINFDRVVEGELDVTGSWGTIWTSWRRALSLMSAGKLKTAPLITCKLSLEEWQTGFKMMEDKSALKVLLKP